MAVAPHDHLPSLTRKKSITLLGATGTIGQNTLKLIAAHPDRFELAALTAGNNVTLLIEQARQFRPNAPSSAIPISARR